jgi:putative hydrolase
VIDFHTHTLFSDGVLLPSELVRRAENAGYRAIGLTDHADGSNLEFVLKGLVKVAAELNRFQNTFVIPGVEITHAPPQQVPQLVQQARKLGAIIVIVHGESPVEPVAAGTNRAGIESKADILAHPGFITDSDAALAAQNGVLLEITARQGHSLTNGHVARMAMKTGAKLVINTDTHTPDNLITRDRASQVLIGAGLVESEATKVLKNNQELLDICKQRLSGSHQD